MKFLIIVLTLCSLAVHAQFTVIPYGDTQGTPLREIKYENVSGTPYFLDIWSKGKVTTKSGKHFVDIPLKYDIMNDKVIFKGDDGNIMDFLEPVSTFEITDANLSNSYKFTNGLPITDGLNASSFFQVIANGKISLFKRVYKKITESKDYGSATVNKSFDSYSAYYVLQNGNLSKISINKKSLIGLLPNKEQEITDYLKKEKTDFKQDSDLKKLFEYINKI